MHTDKTGRIYGEDLFSGLYLTPAKVLAKGPKSVFVAPAKSPAKRGGAWYNLPPPLCTLLKAMQVLAIMYSTSHKSTNEFKMRSKIELLKLTKLPH